MLDDTAHRVLAVHCLESARRILELAHAGDVESFTPVNTSLGIAYGHNFITGIEEQFSDDGSGIAKALHGHSRVGWRAI